MYDQSYNRRTLAAEIQRKDFRRYAPLSVDAHRERLIDLAFKSADSEFFGRNPIRSFHLKKKPAYAIRSIEDDLVVRKLARNLKQFVKIPIRGRDFLVRNLHRILEEGVPYDVYRFDVKSFYESISAEEVAHIAIAHSGLDPRSKKLLARLIEQFHAMGGSGVPRGMGISAILAELVMLRFDRNVSQLPGVYFFGRYVDDILIVTSGKESQIDFTRQVARLLPHGMHLNPKKAGFLRVSDPVSTKPTGIALGTVEYLGYKLSVFEPTERAKPQHRKVAIDIADDKVARLKKRIVRSLLSYVRRPDLELLRDRLHLLASNFTITDVNTGRKKLAGIYYGYPHLSPSLDGLRAIDLFLRQALCSGRGRLFTQVRALLSSEQRRMLLGISFRRGFANRRYVHFHPRRIKTLQECWIHD